MIKHLKLAAVVSGLVVLAAPVLAANCADRDLVVERLKAHYDESFAAGGLQTMQDKQTLVEVWASDETGTFTVMLTSPDGLSCVVATGTDWHQKALEAPESSS